MYFFKDQCIESFGKDDYSMDSASGSVKDTDEDILAGKSQNPEEDEDVNIAEEEYSELA